MRKSAKHSACLAARKAVVEVAVLAAALLLPLVLAACGGSGTSSSRTITPSESAAVATAKAAAHNYLDVCIPKDAAHQILLGKSLLTKDGRQKFATCLAIPKESRPQFEADTLAAAEHVKWSDKSQRRNFFSMTLPALAAKYHSAPVPGASANIPGFTATTPAATPKASKP